MSMTRTDRRQLIQEVSAAIAQKAAGLARLRATLRRLKKGAK